MTTFRLERDIFTKNTTTSKLYIDGIFQCYLLEDTTRPPGVKIPKATAIPYGTYPLVIDFSQRFQRLMPHILNVPDFSGIRIHWGNDQFDTEGCPLTGTTRSVDNVGNSRPAFSELFVKLNVCLLHGPAEIQVVKKGESIPLIV